MVFQLLNALSYIEGSIFGWRYASAIVTRTLVGNITLRWAIFKYLRKSW
jgi:hypothetical protein